ncbi:hypothetical protein FA10DRAFT_278216 [Acaromyces ingoldii]|uniref:Uncharacterized protein n=1 Tax=Acaromyces ingoldii TaxID=215250 RepID=A0A316YQ13_9BASI|nr:hypothetical protein FA10DRAFT_278216 [Acaromyces ingoldii]PWN91379.1 hypothetical protein FA10DRAFT_278216 [Acaromyces ingoldii]
MAPALVLLFLRSNSSSSNVLRRDCRRKDHYKQISRRKRAGSLPWSVTDRSKRASSTSLYSSDKSCTADLDQKHQSQQRRGSRISRLLRPPLQQRQQKSQTEDASVPLRRQLTLLLGRASSDPQGPYAIASSEPKSQRRMQEIQVAQRSNDPNHDCSVRGHSVIFEQKEERRRVSSTSVIVIEQQKQACRSLPTRTGLARKAPLVTMQPGLQQQPPLPLKKASATVPLLPEPPARPDEANILWNQLEKELGVKLGPANTPSSSQSKSVERHKMTTTPHQYSSPTKPTERLRPPARSRASRIPVPSRRLLCTDSGIAPTLVLSSLSRESLPRARPFKTSLKYRKASFDCSKRPPVQAKSLSVRCQSRLPATIITKPVPSSSTDPLVYIAAGESLTRAHSCTSTLWSEPSCYSGVSDSTMPSSMPITPTKPRAPGNAETPPSPTPAPREEIVEMFLDMLRSEQREGFRCDGESFGSPAPSTAPSWRQAWHVATQEREYIGVFPERERRKRIEAIQAMEKWRG